ncbi:hypothetical protein SAMN05444395_101486 [Flavobacterium fryxellicola]|uniref:Uncharacterized protein n=1 Tax=Flavobacterium fryxellicola TaxID=249352 RepID=A0A162PDZ6_9FLAO|nr:hypothetical protein [Flavobacterium fryxellicola]OAB31510.1 hypothetical protein FBFR_01390 [Flavobacterium fryxellicola]SHN53197.1 hypothetical protein SAMN05444395_101486 [Flavobacterium fryxellicola]
MKLTQEQITQIEETLVLNGLNYDDLKLEVTDHMASEIEILMDENDLSFEENARMVFEKWKPQLQPSFSFLIGFTNPKIMTSKCHELVKKQLLIVISVAALIASSVLILVRNSSFITVPTNIEQVFKSFILVEFCLVILVWALIWKSKRQTTYSYLMKKKSAGLIIFLLLLGIGGFPIRLNHPDTKIAFVSIFFAIIYVLLAGFYLQLAQKHFQFEKKLFNT